MPIPQIKSGYPEVLLVARQGWREQAACQDRNRFPDASLWDDMRGDGREEMENAQQRQARIAQAKAVCRRLCPVMAECAATIDIQWDEGVRGGVDIRELREARKAAS